MRKLYEMPDVVIKLKTHAEYDEYNKMRTEAEWDKCSFSFHNMVYREGQYHRISKTSYTHHLINCINNSYEIITLTELKRRLQMFQYGDIITNNGGITKRKVLGVCGDVIFISMIGDFVDYGGGCTQKELERSGYKLHTEEPVEELTMEEVCKELGREVKIKKQ